MVVPINATNSYKDQTSRNPYVHQDGLIELVFNKGNLPQAVYLWVGLKENQLYAALSGTSEVTQNNNIYHASDFRKAIAGKEADKFKVECGSPQAAYQNARTALRGTTLEAVIKGLQK